MSLDLPDANTLEDIISSLSKEDMDNLMNMAQNLFSSSEKSESKNEQKSFADFDFSTITKIASIMSLFSSERKDPRCDLLIALKPLITKDKQQKVDQAIKMLQIMSVLPKLKELNILNLF